jgi:hypothetical protein
MLTALDLAELDDMETHDALHGHAALGQHLGRHLGLPDPGRSSLAAPWEQVAFDAGLGSQMRSLYGMGGMIAGGTGGGASVAAGGPARGASAAVRQCIMRSWERMLAQPGDPNCFEDTLMEFLDSELMAPSAEGLDGIPDGLFGSLAAAAALPAPPGGRRPPSYNGAAPLLVHPGLMAPGGLAAAWLPALPAARGRLGTELAMPEPEPVAPASNGRRKARRGSLVFAPGQLPPLPPLPGTTTPRMWLPMGGPQAFAPQAFAPAHSAPTGALPKRGSAAVAAVSVPSSPSCTASEEEESEEMLDSPPSSPEVQRSKRRRGGTTTPVPTSKRSRAKAAPAVSRHVTPHVVSAAAQQQQQKLQGVPTQTVAKLPARECCACTAARLHDGTCAGLQSTLSMHACARVTRLSQPSSHPHSLNHPTHLFPRPHTRRHGRRGRDGLPAAGAVVGPGRHAGGLPVPLWLRHVHVRGAGRGWVPTHARACTLLA